MYVLFFRQLLLYFGFLIVVSLFPMAFLINCSHCSNLPVDSARFADFGKILMNGNRQRQEMAHNKNSRKKEVPSFCPGSYVYLCVPCVFPTSFLFVLNCNASGQKNITNRYK